MEQHDDTVVQFQQTAQFFNPDTGFTQTLRMPQKIKKREISMPSFYFDDIKGILKQPIKLLNQLGQRRNTYNNTNINNSISKSAKQIKNHTEIKQFTQQDYTKVIGNILENNKKNNKLQHFQKQYSMQLKNIYPLAEKSINLTRDSRTYSRCSVVSNQGERKRSIKVNDPYGLITNNKVLNKTNSKQFLKQRAQDKLVDKLFSQRSDSVQ